MRRSAARRGGMPTGAVGLVLGVVAVLAAPGCVTSRAVASALLPGPSAAPPIAQSASGAGAAPVLAPTDDPAHVWTLDDCLAYAWTHNHAVARARWRVALAQADVEQAEAELLPSLRADGAGTTRSNDSGIRFQGTDFVTSDRSIATGDILATVPLFGTPLGHRAGAHHALLGERDATAQVQADVAFAIVLAVIDIDEATARQGLIGRSSATLRRQEALADERQRAGLAFATDVLADQVRRAERDQDRLHADTDLALATAHLDQLLGLPLDRRLAVAMPGLPTAAPGREADLVAAAFAHRPDLAAARERLLVARAAIRDAQTGTYPRADLFGGYYVSSDSLLLHHQWFGAGLDLSVPLIDNGVVAAQIDASRAKAAAEAETVQELEEEIRQDVHAALLDLAEAAARRPVAARAGDVAQRRLLQLQEQYRQGLADMATLLDAENDVVATRLAEVHATADQRRAAAALLHATQDAAPAP
jgi:outer membrane protein TolC